MEKKTKLSEHTKVKSYSYDLEHKVPLALLSDISQINRPRGYSPFWVFDKKKGKAFIVITQASCLSHPISLLICLFL
jgi:hypothetical protein